MSADRMTSQLIEVADVVGDLGRNIAAAQKLLNMDYIESLRALARMAADHAGGDSEGQETAQAVLSLIASLAPNRYQYTETTIEFSAELAETKQRSSMIGGGATFKMLQVNAAMTMGYGHEYRSAARITATIHAYPDRQLAAQLMDRATAIKSDAINLPLATEIDQQIYDSVHEIWQALGSGDQTPDAI